MSRLYATIKSGMGKDKTSRGSSQIEVIAKNWIYEVSTTIFSKDGGLSDTVCICITNIETGEVKEIVNADFNHLINPDPLQSLIDSTKQLIHPVRNETCSTEA